MTDPVLQRLATWRATEGAVELAAPCALAIGVWVWLRGYLGEATAACGITAVEFAILLGAAAGLAGWASARLLYLLRQRRPWVGALVAMAVLAALLLGLPGAAEARFRATCKDDLHGEVVADSVASKMDDNAGPARLVCQRDAIAQNAYLPGTLLRPRWSGALSPGFWALLLGCAALGALGGRDRRVLPTRLGERLLRLLPLAPAAGWASSPVRAAEGDEVEACANVTWWGELCGQIYPMDKAPPPGRACVRCHQGYRPAERRLRLKVVSLVSADVDELNAWEKVDTVSWGVGQPSRFERSQSAKARWAVLGEIELPDVLTVAQALALVHSRLPGWERAAGDRTRGAVQLAGLRASRVSAWIWGGAGEDRLTMARPERECQLALGPQRLRDLTQGSVEDPWLQLDIGLLPLELWEGRLRATPADGPPERRNLRTALWIPVAPPRLPSEEPGVWVPRVEGDALRAWLQVSAAHGQPGGVGSEPVPYAAQADAAQAGATLDFAMRPLERESNEPAVHAGPGEAISEWLWLEREQIQQLRRGALVLVARGGA